MENAKTIIGIIFIGGAVYAISRIYTVGQPDATSSTGATVADGGTSSDSQPASDPQVAADSQGDQSTPAQGGFIADTIAIMNDKLNWTPPAAAAPYLGMIAAATTQFGLPANLLARVLYQESHFVPDIITGKKKSAAGAVGIAQFEPDTAKDFGIDPLDPSQAIPAAAKYLAQLYKQFGTWDKALAAYNWGQGNVAKKGLTNAPTETKNYFSQILGDLGITY